MAIGLAPTQIAGFAQTGLLKRVLLQTGFTWFGLWVTLKTGLPGQIKKKWTGKKPV